jgi:hypothetical protein
LTVKKSSFDRQEEFIFRHSAAMALLLGGLATGDQIGLSEVILVAACKHGSGPNGKITG